MLPRKIPKAEKRASRWRSPSHCRFVTSHACCVCGSDVAMEAAHVRIGSNTGMGQKPDDFRVVGLCRDCHSLQHRVGERTFWQGKDVDAQIMDYIRASPKRREIEAILKERGV